MAVGGYSQLCVQTKLHLCYFPGNLLPIMACIQPIILYNYIHLFCVHVCGHPSVRVCISKSDNNWGTWFSLLPCGSQDQIQVVRLATISVGHGLFLRHCIQSSNHKACIGGKIFAKNKLLLEHLTNYKSPLSFIWWQSSREEEVNLTWSLHCFCGPQETSDRKTEQGAFFILTDKKAEAKRRQWSCEMSQLVSDRKELNLGLGLEIRFNW